MKVLNIIEDPRIGGPQRRILGLCRGLRERGVETVVASCAQDSERFAEMLATAAVPFETVKARRIQATPLDMLRYMLRMPLDIWRFVRLLRRVRPDLVHNNSSMQMRPVIAAALTRTPLIWHMNDSNMHPLVRRAAFPLLRRVPKLFFIAAERVGEYYEVALDDTAMIVPAPVATDTFVPPKGTPDGEAPEGKPRRIINVGNVNPNKGVDLYMKLSKAVAARVPDVEFAQVGAVHATKEDFGAKLDALAQDLGETPYRALGYRDDLPTLLAESDIFVCASGYEASPTATWEAMACGLPVVSTDVGDVKSLNRKYNFGIVVEDRSVEAMADALVELLENGDLATLSRNARRCAEAEFRRERVVELHHEGYVRVLERASS